MNIAEHLLACLSEECSEISEQCARVSVRVSKALRFGLAEVQPGQLLSNVERLAAELADLQATVEVLQDAGIITQAQKDAKKAKLRKFMEYAERLGAIADPAADPIPGLPSVAVGRPAPVQGSDARDDRCDRRSPGGQAAKENPGRAVAMPEFNCLLIIEFSDSKGRHAGPSWATWCRPIALPFVPWTGLSLTNITKDDLFNFVPTSIEWDHGRGRFNLVGDVDLGNYGTSVEEFLGPGWDHWDEES